MALRDGAPGPGPGPCAGEGGTPAARVGRPLGPLLFVALLLWPDLGLEPEQRRVAAVTAWTATWWITAALPIGVTSLLPAALFPVLGVMPASAVAPRYMEDLVLLFLGAFVLALGLERWNVHRRVALWTIARVGTGPRRLVLGFMVVSAFLSLWINNTSTTLLMLPIGTAVVASVAAGGGGAVGAGGAGAGTHGAFATALMLGMAYSASVGGIGTPVGTAPNQVFLGIFRSDYPTGPAIPFGQWMLALLPLVLLYLPVGWWILTRLALRVPARGEVGVEVIEQERAALGPMSSGERRMTAVFVATALLWVTRAELDLGPLTFPGWAGLLAAGIGAPERFVSDATVGTCMAVLCFVVPADRRRGTYLMDWATASRLPWEVLLLLGGGFAVASGFQESGLDQVLGAELAPLLEGRPEWLVVLAIAAFVAALTEVTSNTATTAVLLPILGGTAVQAGLSPLVTMLPAVCAASCAFMLPVATPPNAVVFSSGLVPAPRMARVGIWMNVAMIGLVTLVFELWTRRVLGIEPGMPAWLGAR